MTILHTQIKINRRIPTIIEFFFSCYRKLITYCIFYSLLYTTNLSHFFYCQLLSYWTLLNVMVCGCFVSVIKFPLMYLLLSFCYATLWLLFLKIIDVSVFFLLSNEVNNLSNILNENIQKAYNFNLHSNLNFNFHFIILLDCMTSYK